MTKDSKLRVVLIGNVGEGKSSVIDSILRSSEPNEKHSDTRINIDKCQSYDVKVEGEDMVFFNTPDLVADEEAIKEIKTCISEDGRHVFVFVKGTGKFTQAEKKVVETIKNVFGEKVMDHMILLFPGGKKSQEDSMLLQEAITKKDDLQALDDECKGRHAIFYKEDFSQLVQQLQPLNDGDCYTYGMLQRAESRVGLRKRVALSVNGGALVGAGVGAGASHIAQGMVGAGVGALIGAAAGGVVGAVGIVIAQHIKEKFLRR